MEEQPQRGSLVHVNEAYLHAPSIDPRCELASGLDPGQGLARRALREDGTGGNTTNESVQAYVRTSWRVRAGSRPFSRASSSRPAATPALLARCGRAPGQDVCVRTWGSGPLVRFRGRAKVASVVPVSGRRRRQGRSAHASAPSRSRPIIRVRHPSLPTEMRAGPRRPCAPRLTASSRAPGLHERFALGAIRLHHSGHFRPDVWMRRWRTRPSVYHRSGRPVPNGAGGWV